MRAFVLMCALFFFFLGSSARAGDAVLLDGVAARVDDKIIFVSDVRARAHPPFENADAAARAMRAALDQMIDAIVVAKEAARLHIEVSQDEIKRARAAVASQNGLTEEQLVLEIHKQGMTEASWESLIRDQILEAKVLQIDTAKEAHPSKAEEYEAWALKQRGVLLQRLRADAIVEVRL